MRVHIRLIISPHLSLLQRRKNFPEHVILVENPACHRDRVAITYAATNVGVVVARVAAAEADMLAICTWPMNV